LDVEDLGLDLATPGVDDLPTNATLPEFHELDPVPSFQT
jgi:hypothetical protein